MTCLSSCSLFYCLSFNDATCLILVGWHFSSKETGRLHLFKLPNLSLCILGIIHGLITEGLFYFSFKCCSALMKADLVRRPMSFSYLGFLSFSNGVSALWITNPPFYSRILVKLFDLLSEKLSPTEEQFDPILNTYLGSFSDLGGMITGLPSLRTTPGCVMGRLSADCCFYWAICSIVVGGSCLGDRLVGFLDIFDVPLTCKLL